jgi:hypothetical protein
MKTKKKKERRKTKLKAISKTITMMKRSLCGSEV